jgi:hypothetical protein
MGEKFELERFEWQAPDRLEIAGTFHGLEQPPVDTPVLVVSGDGEAHQLRSVDASVSGPPEDGKSWQAQFEWNEAPVGIEAAALEFGTGLVVDLPAPGAKRTLQRPRVIEVRRADEDPAPTHEDAAPDDEPPVAPAGNLAREADLVDAEARIQELRAALERAEADLGHARADLEAERTGRSQDAEQFHAGLARVRASAEQALDEAESARAAAESEVASLREQVAAADGLRERLNALEAAGADASEMRDDAQQLVERLTRFAETFDAGR